MTLADAIVRLPARVSSQAMPLIPSKPLIRVPIAACLLGLLAACSDAGVSDIVVGSDSAQASDPPGSSTNNGNSGNNNNGGEPTANGAAAVPNPTAQPMSVTFNCKSEDFSGQAVLESQVLLYDPATIEFFADGARVFNGGFNWVSGSNEYAADRTGTIGTAMVEYFAKVEANGRPSYYRYRADSG